MDGGYIDKNQYLLGLAVVNEKGVIEVEKCREIYRAQSNFPECVTWLVKCVLDKDYKPTQENLKENSILLRDEVL